MKATGIVRKVDELGRVVIPIELRRTLGIAERDALESTPMRIASCCESTNRPARASSAAV